MRAVSFALVLAAVTSLASLAAADVPRGPSCRCNLVDTSADGAIAAAMLGGRRAPRPRGPPAPRRVKGRPSSGKAGV